MATRLPIDMAPADAPMMVTWSGSPPKAAMFSCTQRSDLIKQGNVSLRIGGAGEIAEIEKAKQAQAVVARHHDNIVPRGEGGPIVERFRTRASDKTAPMEIHHDGAFLLVSARRPD